MRVLVLGGAGAVCKETTRDLAKYSDYEQIVVADYNTGAAEALIKEIGDQRLSVVKFDAGDYGSMLKLFPGYDVVVNGLPWKYDLPVTKACLECGVNGLDVSTEEDQWSYHQAAQEKGMVFVPGVGATPGVTNMMAKKGAAEMDTVDEIQINFAAFRCPAPAPGLLITFLWEFHPKTEERTYYRDGEFHWVGPFADLKKVDFGGQIGEQEVCIIPHPETRTMPKSLGASRVSVHGCFPPRAMNLAKTLLEWGLYSEEPFQYKGVEINSLEMIHQLLLRSPQTKDTDIWAYGLVVDVFGRKDGRKVKAHLWNSHPPQEKWGGQAAYYKNIGIPLSIGAQLISKGEVTARGVIPPEEAYDPEVFTAELARRGIEIGMHLE
jgi:lysine 6-dehydrogenase